VKILIDISPEYYDRLLSEFSEESHIYAILKNGVVIHHFEAGDEFRTVEILCEKFHARMILAVAEIFCPEAAADIEEAIRLSRTLQHWPVRLRRTPAATRVTSKREPKPLTRNHKRLFALLCICQLFLEKESVPDYFVVY
jgi:hypothetical protein